MIISAITYAVITVSGVLGSMIAWDDLRHAKRSDSQQDA